MRKNLKGCKKLAGETLAGNFTVPVIGSIAVAAMSAVSSYISTALFPGDSLLSSLRPTTASMLHLLFFVRWYAARSLALRPESASTAMLMVRRFL